MNAPSSRAIQRRRDAAFSLPEVLIVITVVAVLAALVISNMSGIISSSSEAVATKNLKDLNSAVLNFNQANWELFLTADGTTATSGLEIFLSLQYRNSVSPAPGSPYIDPTYAFVQSSDIQTYRAAWNGRMFQMVSPGASGIGMDLLKMTESSGTASFAINYRPVGAP